MRRVCCICGEFETQSRKSSFSFFSIPKKHGLLRANEIQLVERRISAWNAILGQYLNRHYGIQCVCSNHFHSGKPSYLYLENDVDWVPSKNLSNLQQHEESGIENVADCSKKYEKSPTDDEADLSPKRQKIGLSDSDESQNNGDNTATEEPLKQKAVYCRPIQPMNGSLPRVTATIISPESINTAASINNLLLKASLNKSSKTTAGGVSENSQSITVKKELTDFSIADEPDYDLDAAYCFTSKLTVERGTQVTANDIRQAFQSTAATQTLWK